MTAPCDGDGADGGEGDVLGAEQAVADAAEPGGAQGAGARAGDEHFEHGVSEDGGEREDTVDAAGRAEKRQTGSLKLGRSVKRISVKAMETLR